MIMKDVLLIADPFVQYNTVKYYSANIFGVAEFKGACQSVYYYVAQWDRNSSNLFQIEIFAT